MFGEKLMSFSRFHEPFFVLFFMQVLALEHSLKTNKNNTPSQKKTSSKSSDSEVLPTQKPGKVKTSEDFEASSSPICRC